jgi:FAD/FMN-containing dehydrogenase
MMDRPATRAVEEFVHAGYDLEAVAILLCESDGSPQEVEEEIARMTDVLQASGATRISVSRNEAERLRFWSGRKAAFGAMGRISPDYYCMDGTIPRKRLGEVLTFIAQMEAKYGLRCPNVFHAGDGNLHPLILFDANDPGQLARTNSSPPKCWRSASRSAERSPASMAWASRKIDQMCVQFGRDELDSVPRAETRVRPESPAEPWQGGANPLALRGIRPHACARRKAPAPGPAAVLMDAAAAAFAGRIRDAAQERKPLSLRGGGTKDFYGAAPTGEILDTRACAGIVAYEPSELVVTARCGTPLSELETTLGASGQMLAFEPPHFGTGATLGGCVAAGLSGPRRASRRAARFRSRAGR